MVCQIKTFAKSVVVVIWFYFILYLGSNVVQIGEQASAGFSEQHQYLIQLIGYAIILGGAVLLDPNSKQFWQEVRKKDYKAIAQFIGLGIGAYLLGSAMSRLLIQFFPDYEGIKQQFNEYEPLLRCLSIVIVAPVVEEYLFRWKIQGFLKEGFGSGIAIIGQALLFGGLHYYQLQKIYATVLGSLLGYVREKKGIQATIWMHMTVNLLGWIAGCLLTRMG